MHPTTVLTALLRLFFHDPATPFACLVLEHQHHSMPSSRPFHTGPPHPTPLAPHTWIVLEPLCICATTLWCTGTPPSSRSDMLRPRRCRFLAPPFVAGLPFPPFPSPPRLPPARAAFPRRDAAFLPPPLPLSACPGVSRRATKAFSSWMPSKPSDASIAWASACGRTTQPDCASGVRKRNVPDGCTLGVRRVASGGGSGVTFPPASVAFRNEASMRALLVCARRSCSRRCLMPSAKPCAVRASGADRSADSIMRTSSIRSWSGYLSGLGGCVGVGRYEG
eukprot:366296-Chlamydomonas_euryale.AAC.20